MRTKSSAFSAVGCISLIVLTAVLAFTATAQIPRSQTPFSQDSAWSYLKVLAGDIGPRPMGSPSERAAMEYALRKFREFGLQEAFIVPMMQAVSGELSAGVNTNSGTAVGVLKGKTNRTIVIGGHIDSAGPDIPGANDDGSGSVAVIELARVLAQRSNESTIVFALFGGEEQGLRGSRHFVRNFDRMNDVALMLQIDMTNGSDWLLPLVDAKDHLTPRWLVEASYEEFEALGYSGLFFPTHFYAFLTSLPGGGIGSDHEPFLEKGIPAIDFTSDVTDPIHTPQDNLENFIPSGLKRSGDLVYRLVERFDTGVPAETSVSYYLLQFDTALFFFPIWSLYVFFAVALVLAIIALSRMRKARIVEEPRRKVPGLKLFLLMILIQTFVWLSENVVGIIKGSRFPWLSNLDGYFLLGFFAAGLGIWVALQLAPRMGFSREPYRYALKGMIILGVFLLLMLLASPKLALAAAMGMFFLALSFLVDSWYLKFIFWLVSPHFMYRLIFSEGYGLLARSMTGVPLEGFVASLLLHLFFILFFSLWAFPFLLGFAAIRFQKPESFVFLTWFRKPIGGIVACVIFAGFALFLSLQPTYSPHWQQQIAIRQAGDLNSQKVTIDLASPDYLGDMSVQIGGKDTVLSGRDRNVRLMENSFGEDPWIRVERSIKTIKGTNTTFTMLLKFHFKHRPYTFDVSYRGGTAPPQDVDTPVVWSPEGKSVAMRWYSFPDTLLVVPLKMTVIGSDSLTESITATFVQPIIPVVVKKDQASVNTRTTMSVTEVIRKP